VAVGDPGDPVAMAQTWARGGRTGIVAVDVHATDREHGPGRGGELCHTMINFL
jgi:hypothetical protein